MSTEEPNPTARYESTKFPSVNPPRSYGNSAGNLGKSNPTSLAEAFIGRADENTALTDARTKMAAYEGENDMFPQYRRNFVPAGGTLTAEYVDVRNKSSVTTGPGTGLGTAYSPTIASPGESNGLSPANLRSVAGATTAVLLDATDSNGPNRLYNPTNEAHKTRSDAGSVGDIGGVRRFKLGIASSTQTTLTENNSRGQFPGQPVGP